MYKYDCVAILKEQTDGLYFPEVNWHDLQITKPHFRYTIWFMISEKIIIECTIFRGRMAPKVSTRHRKKLYTRIFNLFNRYITFMWISSLRRYEHLHAYRKQKFQNILETNLSKYFGLLLHIY